MSIRRRLLVWLLSSVLVAGLAAAAIVFTQARRQVDALFDYQLRQLALTLRDRTYSPQQLAEALRNDEAADFVITVWGPDGTLLYESHPEMSLAPAPATGLSDLETTSGRWRVFAIWHRGLTIQVAQHRLARDMLTLGAAWRTLLPFMLALPLMGWLIWRLVGQEMKVLVRTAHAVARRTPESLEPIEARSVPDEVQPLVHALNGLMGRLGDALAHQRQFIADAAHELRTPLTALKLQLQLAERAPDDAARAQAHAALREGITRATRLVEQLLTLARADPDAVAAAWQVVDVTATARSVVETALPAARSKGLALTLEAADPVHVRGDPAALQSMMQNLVDNAVRYTSAGRVRVQVRQGRGEAEFEVSDTGPGIPAAERERVFDRFYRGERVAEGGAGLGLAIARRVAQRHGGRITLEAPAEGPGLVARVRLPLSPA